MALFLVAAMSGSEPVVDAAVSAKIPPGTFYRIEQGKWIIDSEAITAKDISDQLGIAGTVRHLVVAIRGYYGRAQPDMWEWMAAKSAKS